MESKTLPEHITILQSALLSRQIDQYESKLSENGKRLPHVFSAAGHEVAQAIAASKINHPDDGVFSYYRSKCVWLSVGLALHEYVNSAVQAPGSYGNGRNVSVLPFLSQPNKPTIAPVFGGVGSQFEPALGWARALKMKQKPSASGNGLAFVFAGDGAVSTGGFWSAVRESAAHKLPLVIVIENNGIALSTPSDHQFLGNSIAQQFESYQGIETHRFDGAFANTNQRVGEIIENARLTGEPVMLEFSVSRLAGHSIMDKRSYLDTAEPSADPLEGLKQHLIVSKQLSVDKLVKLESELSDSVKRAFDSAENLNQDHKPTKELKTRSVPSTTIRKIELEHQFGSNKVSIGHGINCWLRCALQSDSTIVLIGEDIGRLGGAHGITRGLQDEFGAERVIDASLNESSILGQAMGLALRGFRPIVEIQYRKYLDPAMEQFHNIGWCDWLTEGKFKLPIIFRIPFGRDKVNDPWHSESNESQILRAVGFDVICPSTTIGAINAFDSAYSRTTPTVILEHRDLYYSPLARTPIDGLQNEFDSSSASIRREGSDLSIVSWGRSVFHALKAADAKSEIAVEVIDLHSLKPWDFPTLFKSISKTGRCLIVHEDRQFMGLSAEIAVELTERLFSKLKLPIQRLGALENPVPIADSLVQQSLPNDLAIRKKVREMLNLS